MFNRRMLMALAAIMVFSAPVFAGSGGAKKDATIVVRNDQASPIAVFVGQTAVTKAASLPQNPTQAQIEAAGGVVVNAGKESSTKVVAGTHPVLARNATGGTKTTSVAITKGSTKKLAFNKANEFVAY